MKTIKNYLFNTSYQLLTVLSPLITAPYVSRILGTEGVGLNTVTGAVAGYFILFAVLGTATYGNREIAYHQNNRIVRSQIFWGINFLSWITAGVTLVVFSLFLFTIHQNRNLYFWQGIGILTAMFDISWYFIGMEKFKIIAVRNFIFKTLTILSVFIFVKKSSDLALYIIITAGGNLISSFSLWPYLRSEVMPPVFKKLHLKHHLWYTTALFFPTIAIQIYSIANKHMIGVFDSVAHAGLFDQSDKLIRMSMSLVTSIGAVMLPKVANMHANGDKAGIRQSIVKTFDLATGISTAIFFGILGIALNFAPFFFSRPFAFAGVIMMVESPIIIFLAWSIVFGVQYLLPLNRMKSFTISVTIGAICNIILNFIFIPLFGVVGAAINTVIAEFLVTAYQLYTIRHEFSLVELFSNIWKYFLAGLVMFGVVFWMNQQFKMTATQLLLQVLVGALIYLTLNILLDTQLWQYGKMVIDYFRHK